MYEDCGGKVKRYFLLFLLFFGCEFNKNSSLDEFYAKTYLALLGSSDVKFSKHVIEMENISNPVGTWILVASFTHDKGQYCFVYRTPLNTSKGKIRLEFTKTKCGDEKSDQLIISRFDHIKNLKLQMKERVLSLHLEGENEIRYDFPNIYKKQKSKSFQSFVESKGHFLSIISNSKKNIKMIGNYSDRFENNSAILCQSFDSNCREIIKFKCDRCKYGYFEVVSHNCSNKRNKYCGISRCGSRNEPACIRGNLYEPKMKLGCINGSEEGFCQKGLNSFCNSYGVLLCL